MREGLHVRRLGGLATVFLGLILVFASLTLVAVSRGGLAAVFAIGGVVLMLLGLRILPGSVRREVE